MRKQFAIMVVIMITAGLVGGATFYLVDAKNTKDKEALQSQINDLSAKLANNVNTNTNAVVATNSNVNTNATISPTAGWKTYTNSTYKYSFKYPATYTINELAKAFEESMNASCQSVNLNTKTSIYACDVAENLTTYGLREPNGMDPESTTDLNIGDRAAIKYVSGDSVSYVTMSPTNNRIVINGATSDITNLELMLGTFNFN